MTRHFYGLLTAPKTECAGSAPHICRDMTTTEFLIGVFALLSIGLLLPLPSGARSALFLALVALGVLTFIDGGVEYLISLFQ